MALTKILIGDDQLGVPEGERMRDDFELDYENQLKDASLTYTADPDRFIEMAKQDNYDVLLIDLKWCPDDSVREHKTGYRILETVREYAPIRVLWTSERAEDRDKGYQYGATHCISKRPVPSEFEKVLLGK